MTTIHLSNHVMPLDGRAYDARRDDEKLIAYNEKRYKCEQESCLYGTDTVRYKLSNSMLIQFIVGFLNYFVFLFEERQFKKTSKDSWWK